MALHFFEMLPRQNSTSFFEKKEFPDLGLCGTGR
jgi:hypothetical protein